MRNRGRAGTAAATGGAIGLGGLVLVLAACGSSGTNANAGAAYGGSGMSATPAASGSMGGSGTTSGMGTKTVTLTMRTTKIGKVLTDVKGDTLYWYSKDTKDRPSTCTSSCLAAWPMVAGKAVAASGVKFAGTLGSVTNAGGAIQATYNGYPLYTYKADMAPGTTLGNGLGGVWHVITGSNLTAASTGMGSSGGMASATPTKSASSGGYGYGSGVPASSGTSSGTSSGNSGSAVHSKASTAAAPAAPAAPAPTTAAPAPAQTSPVNGGGCGSGACW
jgi:predicted lipoprotein with Yx(FWY)xxD motif